jgi:hypothetical protein
VVRAGGALSFARNAAVGSAPAPPLGVLAHDFSDAAPDGVKFQLPRRGILCKVRRSAEKCLMPAISESLRECEQRVNVAARAF